MTLASQLTSWSKLEKLAQSNKVVLRDAFAKDAKRFDTYSRHFQGDRNKDISILLDFSKNLIDEEIWSTLLTLAKEAKVEEQRQDMFNGEQVNASEGRSVLHVALRDLDDDFKGKDHVEGVNEVVPELKHIREFSEAVRNGQWK